MACRPSRAAQRTVIGTLGDIAEKAREAGLEPPTVIVIGEVVRLRGQLNWFEQRPLFGRRILVTRAKGQAAEFADLITAFGGEPITVAEAGAASRLVVAPIERFERRLTELRRRPLLVDERVVRECVHDVGMAMKCEPEDTRRPEQAAGSFRRHRRLAGAAD